MPVCCGYCHGKLSSRRWKTCPCCGSKLSKNDIVDCKHLRGSGSIKMYPCPTCEGKGKVNVKGVNGLVSQQLNFGII